MKRLNSVVVILFLSILLSGCGKKRPDGLPDLFPTTVIVTQDGKPLEGAIVNMVQEDGQNQWSPVGMTDSAGKAMMSTNGMYEGAPAGKHKVIVIKQVTERPGANPMDDPAKPDMDTDYDQYQEWYMKNQGKIDAYEKQTPKIYDLVDPVFSKPETSTLTVEVTGKGEHTIDVGKETKTVYDPSKQ